MASRSTETWKIFHQCSVDGWGHQIIGNGDVHVLINITLPCLVYLALPCLVLLPCVLSYLLLCLILSYLVVSSLCLAFPFFVLSSLVLSCDLPVLDSCCLSAFALRWRHSSPICTIDKSEWSRDATASDLVCDKCRRAIPTFPRADKFKAFVRNKKGMEYQGETRHKRPMRTVWSWARCWSWSLVLVLLTQPL